MHLRYALFVLTSTVFASNTAIICSTGFSVANASSCGSAITSPASNNLFADGNWYEASTPSGTFMGQAFVTVNNAYPLQNVGPWLSNNASGNGTGSAWITPSNNQAQNYMNNTTSYYSTTFDLTGLDPSAGMISGFWLADDYGGGIYLNGVSVGQAALPAFGGVGGPMVPFTITDGNPGLGQASFLPGQNVLTFAVINDATNGGTINNPADTPTGLRVLITDAEFSPEPATWALAGVGLGALLVAARRRRAAQVGRVIIAVPSLVGARREMRKA